MGNVVKVQEVIEHLRKEGFIRVSQEYSHAKYVHVDDPARYAIVPSHSMGAEIPKGTLKSIERTSRVKF